MKLFMGMLLFKVGMSRAVLASTGDTIGSRRRRFVGGLPRKILRGRRFGPSEKSQSGLIRAET
jgi:hypothetical protein